MDYSFYLKMNRGVKNTISIHREWQGVIQQSTVKMDAESLTSPSGPRADSPPSAFSSAFCKTMSNARDKPRRWVQEALHGNSVVQ